MKQETYNKNKILIKEKKENHKIIDVIGKKDYLNMIEGNNEFKSQLTFQINKYPELFPTNIKDDWSLYRPAKTLQLIEQP